MSMSNWKFINEISKWVNTNALSICCVVVFDSMGKMEWNGIEEKRNRTMIMNKLNVTLNVYSNSKVPWLWRIQFSTKKLQMRKSVERISTNRIDTNKKKLYRNYWRTKLVHLLTQCIEFQCINFNETFFFCVCHFVFTIEMKKKKTNCNSLSQLSVFDEQNNLCYTIY